MGNRRFWTKERQIPGDDALQGAVDSWRLLRWLHPPTASALALGAAGGAYLGWNLLKDHGLIAIIFGVLAGLILGAIVGVIAYWLIRLFIAMGN